ncbi:MAG: hypothetical protein AAGG01_13865 [Planctomycetota bacterium]
MGDEQAREREQRRFEELLRAGAEVWRDYCNEHAGIFHRVIPADHALAIEVLRDERERAHTFLELGSATGVITILADLLGFEAYGIEIEPTLVETAERLAEDLDSAATFVEGSFVPPDYQDEVDLLESDYLTPTEGANAYADMGLDLADFDLVYAYPWPGEEDWLIEMVRRFGGPRTRLMIYTVRDGYEILDLE